MKKIMAIILSLVFIFAFSTVAFANGEEVKVDEVTSGDEYIYTDGADEAADSPEDILADLYGQEFADAYANGEIGAYAFFEEMGLEKSTVVMAMLLIFAVLLFIPVLIVLIVFISKNKKLKEKIRGYELTYGVVYDKDVLKDMANIPPQNYNYNPQTFVPQYPVNNAPQQNNTDISAFSNALKNETNKENNDGGNL